jgi:hypothetical protein
MRTIYCHRSQAYNRKWSQSVYFYFLFFFTIYYFLRQSFYGVRKYVTSPNKLHGRQMICFWMTFCIIYSVKCCISFNNSYCLELMYICDDYDRFVFVFSQQYSKKKKQFIAFFIVIISGRCIAQYNASKQYSVYMVHILCDSCILAPDM